MPIFVFLILNLIFTISSFCSGQIISVSLKSDLFAECYKIVELRKNAKENRMDREEYTEKRDAILKKFISEAFLIQQANFQIMKERTHLENKPLAKIINDPQLIILLSNLCSQEESSLEKKINYFFNQLRHNCTQKQPESPSSNNSQKSPDELKKKLYEVIKYAKQSKNAFMQTAYFLYKQHLTEKDSWINDFLNISVEGLFFKIEQDIQENSLNFSAIEKIISELEVIRSFENSSDSDKAEESS